MKRINPNHVKDMNFLRKYLNHQIDIASQEGKYSAENPYRCSIRFLHLFPNRRVVNDIFINSMIETCNQMGVLMYTTHNYYHFKINPNTAEKYPVEELI